MVGSGQKAKCCVTGGWQICILFVGDMKKKLMQHVRSLRDYSYLHGNQNE